MTRLLTASLYLCHKPTLRFEFLDAYAIAILKEDIQQRRILKRKAKRNTRCAEFYGRKNRTAGTLKDRKLYYGIKNIGGDIYGFLY